MEVAEKVRKQRCICTSKAILFEALYERSVFEPWPRHCALSSWASYFTVTVSFSTQVYEWVTHSLSIVPTGTKGSNKVRPPLSVFGQQLDGVPTLV